MLKILLQNFYEVNDPILSKAKRVKSIPKVSNTYILSIGVVSELSVAQWSLLFKMADHENIVKRRLNLPLSRSNLLLFFSRC